MPALNLLRIVFVATALDAAQVRLASGFTTFSFSRRSSSSSCSINTKMAAASEYFDNNDRYEYTTDNANRVQGRELQRLNNEWKMKSSSNNSNNARAAKLDRNGVRYNSYAYHEKSTVNGMNDYYTDNLDRVGGFIIANDDSGRGIRKVNSLPASINGAGSASGSNLILYGDNSRHRNYDSKGFSRKGTVNGMSDYYTNLTDRMGSAHLENNNNWNVSMKNTNETRPGVRAKMRAPSSRRHIADKNQGIGRGRGSTVNGMSDYETDNIDRIGGFLGTNSGDSW